MTEKQLKDSWEEWYNHSLTLQNMIFGIQTNQPKEHKRPKYLVIADHDCMPIAYCCEPEKIIIRDLDDNVDFEVELSGNDTYEIKLNERKS